MDPRAVIARAKREVAEEQMTKATTTYKAKLRELAGAQTIVANIEREIKDLELKMELGQV